jgi:hypothetical protein
MPVVAIPAPYRGSTRGEAEVSVSGCTVIECLKAVEERHPGFLSYVFDDAGGVHRFVKLFVNSDQIDASALSMELGASDQLEVLAAIAGG